MAGRLGNERTTTQNLLVEDATEEEINAAVAGVSAGNNAASGNATDCEETTTTVTVTVTPTATAAAGTETCAPPSSTVTVTVTPTATARR